MSGEDIGPIIVCPYCGISSFILRSIPGRFLQELECAACKTKMGVDIVRVLSDGKEG